MHSEVLFCSHSCKEWVFDLQSPSCQLEPVWPLFADLFPQQGISAPSIFHKTGCLVVVVFFYTSQPPIHGHVMLNVPDNSNTDNSSIIMVVSWCTLVLVETGNTGQLLHKSLYCNYELAASTLTYDHSNKIYLPETAVMSTQNDFEPSTVYGAV